MISSGSTTMCPAVRRVPELLFQLHGEVTGQSFKGAKPIVVCRVQPQAHQDGGDLSGGHSPAG